ncbi:MAG: alpha/beta hydrolase [Myxococcales bacterium FL481]|nr:MAG: alpha/beta hydrolase [Myxococcales bacterium FL481]
MAASVRWLDLRRLSAGADGQALGLRHPVSRGRVAAPAALVWRQPTTRHRVPRGVDQPLGHFAVGRRLSPAARCRRAVLGISPAIRRSRSMIIRAFSPRAWAWTELVGRTAVAGWACIVATGCSTLDPFFFTNEHSDGYAWDADPCDPQLQGELAEVAHARLGGPPPDCHPSTVPAARRHEGLLTISGRDVHYVFAERIDPIATIFYSHGRSQHLGRYWDRVELLWNLGYSVMIYDYPGYGRSEGEPDEQGIYASAVAVFERLRTMPGVDLDAVYLYGYSLGGAPTYELARRASHGELSPVPRGVISESAFCSTETLVQDGAYLNLPVEFVATNRFDSCSAISKLDPQLPVLILHGTKDTFLLPVHARKLRDASQGRAQLTWIDGADHIEIPTIGDTTYLDAVAGFIGTPDPSPR